MELEQQVTNLELSKKLKELGVPQVSEFYYTSGGDKPNIQWRPSVGLGYFSAYTVAELGEMLPGLWITQKDEKGWIAGEYKDLSTDEYERADTEADARAKMLIYLLENNLIKLTKNL